LFVGPDLLVEPERGTQSKGSQSVALASSADERARAQNRVRWELLYGLIRKDLKVKYQGSALGFLWSLANPLLLLIVYTFVFQVVLKSGIPKFGYFLLSGLLVWNAFTGSVSTATDAVVGNAGLVKKVRFPLGVLPLTSVGFHLVHFALQLIVLLVVMLVTGYTAFIGWHLLLAIPAITVALLLTVGLSFLVAGLNVRYRDTKHIVEVVLMAGFWVNPIVYSVSLVQAHLHGWVGFAYYLNPIAGVVTTMQRALYAKDLALGNGERVLADPGYQYYLERLGLGAVVSLLILWLGISTYRRLSADFAEEL
jgi:ABC-2 type transport system permease protein